MAREGREGGATNGASAAAAAPTPAPWASNAATPPWRPQAFAQRPAAETDPLDSEQTALLRAAQALFENYDLPTGALDEIRKRVPPQRPAPKKQPRVSREQEAANLQKKVPREEQELDERKTAAEIAKIAADEEQERVTEQATVVSNLRNRLAELRHDIGHQLVRKLVMLDMLVLVWLVFEGSSLSLSTIATSAFATLFAQGLVFRCHLSICLWFGCSCGFGRWFFRVPLLILKGLRQAVGLHSL